MYVPWPTGRPQLRLFDGDGQGERESIRPGGDPPGDVFNSPQWVDPSSTLSEFFEAWFLPVVLIGQRDNKPGALRPYREALAHWERITDRIPIARISPVTVALVQSGLRTATDRRRGLSSAEPAKRVSPSTVIKWQGCLRAILQRLGPTHPWRPDMVGAGVLPAAPSLTVDDSRRRSPVPRHPFTLAQARAMMAATVEVGTRRSKYRHGRYSDLPTHGADPHSPAWWRAYLALLFYSGVRAESTALSLRRRHLVWDPQANEGRGGWWLDVPVECVPKTDKPVVRFVHPCLERMLRGVRPGLLLEDWPADAMLCPQTTHYSHIASVHDWLLDRVRQTDPTLGQLSPQAWRRTFGDMVATAVDARLDRAAWALDHADRSTTEGSYVGRRKHEAEVIRGLPDLD